MKAILFAVPLIFCTGVQAATEGVCLVAGERAELFSKYKKDISEAEMEETIEKSFQTANAKAKSKADREVAEIRARLERSVLSYVWTMNLAPQEARKMVYLKCKAGEYDSLAKNQ